MERLTKIVVLSWACAALACDIWLLSSSWPSLPLLACVVAAALAAISAFDRRVVGLVIAFAYVSPALIRILHGGAPYAPYAALWMSALVGAMMPQAIRTSWHIPAPWRAVLVAAALVVVATSPVVALREIDLTPGLLADRHAWSFSGTLWPSLAVTWILHVSLTLVVGVLWFDWLFGARGLDFRSVVVAPFVGSALVLAAVSTYQLLFDVRFLNDTVFGSIGRASGTMFDANVSGTLAAMWVGGMYLWARRTVSFRAPLVALAILANWLAVWATGSRTAFLAAAIVSLSIGVSLLKDGDRRRARTLWMMAAALGAIAVVVALASALNPRIVGPLGRVWATLPGLSIASVRDFAAEMWNRNGYGTAATAMFREAPFFGTGVGTYHTLAGAYLPGTALPPDNAQNWLRHQLVEFGLVGGAAWVAWFVLFALFVLRIRQTDDPSVWVTRGVLTAFSVISLLGMPGQDAMVAVTLWTFAFWHVSEAGPPADRPISGSTWGAVVAIVLVAMAGTAELALTRLRLPVRELTATSPYSYGFSPLGTQDGEGEYRRTRAHAVAVLDAPYRWIEVSVRLDRPSDDEAIDVRVWTNGGTLLKGRLQGALPLTAVVQLPAESRRVLLEAAARRADSNRPWFLRSADPQFLLKWEFLERPPAGYRGYAWPVSS